MSKEAIEHYEAALKEAFPSGATGNVFHHWNEARKALAEQPAQQEPVAWWDSKLGVFDEKHFDQLQPLYTSPQPAKTSKPWVGLTDEEVKHEWVVWRASIPRYMGFAKGIEAKLRERNT